MNEHAFLCERCGYPLDGLAVSGNCPECGLAVAQSDPARRPGSAWQIGPSARTWLLTGARTLTNPRSTFRAGRSERRRSSGLAFINCLTASLLIVLPWTGVLIGDPARGMPKSGLVSSLVFSLSLAAQTGVVALVLFGLTAIEHAGIRFFAARRRWRLSNGAAWQVCGHASVGWILAPTLALTLLATLTALERFFSIVPRGVFRLRLGSTLDLGTFGWGDATHAAILLGSGLAGLLAFELLVYAGVRECRFANSPRAIPDTTPPGAPNVKAA